MRKKSEKNKAERVSDVRFRGAGDDSIFIRLRRGVEKFTSMQKVVCSYILENYQRVAFMTVEELAGLCGASPATVVRTVKALDYASFHEMQAEFEKLLMSTQVSSGGSWNVHGKKRPRMRFPCLGSRRTTSTRFRTASPPS